MRVPEGLLRTPVSQVKCGGDCTVLLTYGVLPRVLGGLCMPRVLDVARPTHHEAKTGMITDAYKHSIWHCPTSTVSGIAPQAQYLALLLPLGKGHHCCLYVAAMHCPSTDLHSLQVCDAVPDHDHCVVGVALTDARNGSRLALRRLRGEEGKSRVEGLHPGT
jgi:hypothetical protein